MATPESISALLSALDAAAGHNSGSARPLSAAVLALLQDGLQGNRAVSASPWAVVQAAARAYPLQLADTVDRAKAVCPGEGEDDLCNTWALQAVADGSLAPLLCHVAAQPQLLTAYKRGAPLRDKNALQPIIQKLEAVKGTFPGPYDLWQANQQQQQQQQQQQVPSAAPGLIVSESAGVADASKVTSHTSPSSSSSKVGGSSPASTSTRVETEEDARRAAGSKAAGTSGPTAVAGAVAAARAAAAGVAAAARHPLAAGRGLVEPLKRHNQQQQQQQEAAVQQTGQDATLHAQPPVSSTSSTSTSSSTAKDGGGRLRNLMGAGVAAGLKAATAATAAAAAAVPAVRGHVLGGHAPAGQDAAAAAAAGTGVIAPATSSTTSINQESGNSSSRSLGAWLKQRARGSSTPEPGATLTDTTTSSSATAAGGPVSAGGVWRDSTGAVVMPQPLAAAAAGLLPSESTAESQTWVEVLLQVVGSKEVPGAQAVQLLLRYTTPAPAATNSTSSSGSGSSKAWHLPGKGLIGGLGASLGRSSRQAGVEGGTGAGPKGDDDAAGQEGGNISRQGTGVVLDRDHWSLLGALKPHKGQGAQQGAEEGGSSSTRGSKRQAAAQELAQQLQATQQAVLQQATAAADAVQASAWQGKGVLDEECAAVLQLVAAVQQLLEHGLIGLVPPDATAAAGSSVAAGQGGPAATGSEGSSKLPTSGSSSSSSSSGLSAAWGSSLPGWLGSKQPHPLQALQALEVGDKQLPPVQLGAGAVLQSTVVRTLPTHQQTEWWVRSSLNQRLLGYRLAVIASRAQQQLGKHYHPGAALLSPQQQLQPLVKAVKGCDVLRFDLTVPQPDAVAPGPASGARAAAAAMAMASQGFNKLAAKLPMVPRLPSFAPGGSGAASSSNGGAAGGVAPTAAAAGVPAPSAFAWPEDSTAAAASGPASSSSRRRVAPIRESPGGPDAESAGDVMSPASSGLLSPLANSDDATADWWNPVEGWTGPGNQAEATRRSSSSSSGAPLPHETAATAASGDGSGSSNSRPPSVGAAAAGGIGRQAPSAAVQQLEQQLSQTLAAPLPALLVRTRRSTDSDRPASEPGPPDSSRSRSSTPGWQAAVAAARAKCQQRPASAQGMAVGAAAAAAAGIVRSQSSHWGGDVGAGQAGAAVAGSGRRIRHEPKRSSSANDLPELYKLTNWDPRVG